MQLDYSVDMVRLSKLVKGEDFQRFSKQYLELDPRVKHSTSMKYKDYRDMWHITQSILGYEFNYMVAYRHNAEKVGNQYNLVIEFNPNKCHAVEILGEILKTFFDKDFEVKSCDIAIDIPCNILDLTFDKGSKIAWKVFNYGESDDKTYYFGEGPGRVKVYNKARELKRSDIQLTRYEVTYKLKKTRQEVAKGLLNDVMNEGLPKAYRIGEKDVIDPTMRVIHYAVMNGYNINDLSRKYKDKYKAEIEQNEVEIDLKKIKECISQYILNFDHWVNTNSII